MRFVLREAGFLVCRRPEGADVIIAHSGGCFMLPSSRKAQQVILVGLPHWPGKRLSRGVREKLRNDAKDLWWYKNALGNMYYLVTRPRKWSRMVRAIKADRFPEYSKSSVLFIRNEQDVFSHPVESVGLAAQRGWGVRTLGGEHDDIWRNPDRYIELID